MTKHFFLGIVITLLAHATPCSAAPGEIAKPSRTKLVLLGTGTPNADPERWGTALAIVVDDHVYLVDAGVGIVRRAAAVAAGSVPQLAPRNLNRVFITHLHSDHTIGLPDLLLSPWVLERPEPLDVYGPHGITEMITNIERAWSADIEIREHGGEPHHPGTPHAIVHEIKPGEIFRDEFVRVEAIPVAHGTWPQAFGYKFTTGDGVIVISGDTRPCDSIVTACEGCDVLVHEAYSAEKFRSRPSEWQNYHRAFHTSAAELAGIANRAHPKLLVLYHQLFWGASDEDLVREIHDAGYGGDVVSGRDLQVIELSVHH